MKCQRVQALLAWVAAATVVQATSAAGAIASHGLRSALRLDISRTSATIEAEASTVAALWNRMNESFQAFISADETLDLRSSAADHLAETNDPGTLAEYCSGESGEDDVSEGQRVEADWKGYGMFYPGKIVDINRDGSYDVLYDDGWTEKRLKPGEVKIIKDKKEEKKAKPQDDPACKLNDFVLKVKRRVGDLRRNIRQYLAQKSGRQAKKKERAEEKEKKKIYPDVKAGAPSPADGELPAGSEEQQAMLRNLKAILAKKDKRIEELTEQVEENEEAIEKEDKKNEVPAAAMTMDDLINMYRDAIAKRDQKIHCLKEQLEEQEERLEKEEEEEFVTLSEIDNDTKELSKDVDEARAKRAKLEKDGELDPELRSSLDAILKEEEKLKNKVAEMIQKEKDAKARRKAAREARKKAAEAAARADAEAEAEAEAEAQALEKESEKADKEVVEAVKEVDKDLESVQTGTKKLDTGVHPHGEKWWRYRYEHSYVEGILALFIAFLMLIYERLFYYLRAKVYEISNADEHDAITHGTGYIKILEYMTGELMVCLFVFITCWVLAQLDAFEALAEMMEKDKEFRLPKTALEYRRLAFDLCVCMFVAVIFYYMLILSVVHNTASMLGHWSKLEHDSLDDTAAASLSATSSAATQGAHLTGDVQSMTIGEYTALKQSFLKVVSADDRIKQALLANGEEWDPSTFNFIRYIKANVRTTVDLLFKFGWMVWSLMMFTFVCLILLHRFMNMGYIRIMMTYGSVFVVLLGLMAWWIGSISDYHSEDEGKTQNDSWQLRLHQQFSTEIFCIHVMHYTLFFLCYGASRMITQPWMWELHFKAVLCLTFVTFFITVMFIEFVAPMIPKFAVALSLPPYIDPGDTKIMAETIRDTRMGTFKKGHTFRTK